MSTVEQRIANLSPAKRALLEQRLLAKWDLSVANERIQQHSAAEAAPLSFSQQRLWFIQQLEAAFTGYNEATAYRLLGPLDLKALQASFTEIMRRHAILRTTITVPSQEQEAEPVQIVHPPCPFPLPLIDRQQAQREQWDEITKAACEALRRQPLDLARAFPWQAQLLQFAPQTHVLILVRHHIASDGWSSSLFRQELATLYTAFRAGKPSPLPPLPVQYADYARWQRSWINGKEAQSQLAYWKAQLAGLSPLNLPTDYPRPQHQSYRGAVVEFTLSPEVSQALRTLSRTTGCSLFMTMLAAFKVLLYRYSGQTDVGVGVSVANRQRVELEPLIGFFVNNLIFRTELEGALSFRTLLARVRQVAIDAFTHQHYPFDRLLHDLAVTRDLSRNPLAQVRFALRDDYSAPLQLADLQMERIPLDYLNARFDLHLRIVDHGTTLQGAFSYNQDLFSPARIRRLCAHYQTLVTAIVADPDCALAALPLLTAAERDQQVVTWNQTTVDFPVAPLHHLIEQQVARTPMAIALQDATEQLTYAELNRRANRLAHQLLAQGVTPEVPVALLAQRSANFVVAVLAILKANAVYLPLDPRHPLVRHQQILAQSQCRYLLADRAARSGLAAGEDKQQVVLVLEDLLQQPAPETTPPLPARPAQLAYLLYTSGSTGAPKGAMIQHDGMVNHLWAKVRELGLTQGDVIAQNAAQSFDISVWQMFVGLIIGARVQVVSEEVAMNPLLLLQEIARRQITILEVVPSLLRALLVEIESTPTAPALPTLRWLIPTGEALPPSLCNHWLAHYPTIPLLNAYGPTECSDDVTHYPIHAPLPADTLYTPIGRPIANMQAYVLDSVMQPVPIGVAGELWIGGIGVGRGYLNDPERTAQTFVATPAQLLPSAAASTTNATVNTSRLYRTGDLARYREDGNLEFLGRIDHQVKIRGFRIELEEIAFVLRQHPAVQECVVTAHVTADKPHDSRLVAYVTQGAADPTSDTDLQRFVQERLPEYMTPAAIVRLAALPLTANGKIDRAALPAPEWRAPRPRRFREAQTPVEKWLTAQMSKFLGNNLAIGLDDNFFSLGGDSIRAALFINQLQRELGEILYVVALFDAPTVAQLADYLQQHYPQALARVCDYRPAQPPVAALAVDSVAIARFRQLIPAVNCADQTAAPCNAQAIFILSAPRSGSTLLRVMLAGHSQLFAPQELDLLNFATLGERKAALHERFSFRLEGLLRAMMALHGCDPDGARQLMNTYEQENLSTHAFYRLLQQWIGPTRRLVDKTPAYALDPATLQRAEVEFSDPLYIHLTRHPLGMIQSFEEAHTDQVFFRHPHDFSPRTLAELTWLVSHQNILSFCRQLPATRYLRISYEELVRTPVTAMEHLGKFLGLPFEAEMAQPYVNQEKRMTDGLYAVSKMLGDAKFHTHQQIDAANAERWRGTYAETLLSEATWQVANTLGYQAPTVSAPPAVMPATPTHSIPRAPRVPVRASQGGITNSE